MASCVQARCCLAPRLCDNRSCCCLKSSNPVPAICMSGSAACMPVYLADGWWFGVWRLGARHAGQLSACIYCCCAGEVQEILRAAQQKKNMAA